MGSWGSDALVARIRRIALVELHVHLRGAMPHALFAELFERHGAEAVLRHAPPAQIEQFSRYSNLQPLLQGRLPAVDAIDKLFAFTSFVQFLNTYLFTGYYFRETDDFARLVRAVVRELQAQGIVYAEVFVSLPEYLEQGLPIEALLEVLDSEAATAGGGVRFLVDPVRNYGPDRTLALVRRLAERRARSVVGITIGGNEAAFPPAQFAETFRAARDAGLRLTAHAGEALGPESVRDAIDLLGVERIGHGVRAAEAPELVAELAARRIALEVCPTSNLCLGVYPSMDEHPASELRAAGVPVTINTDDPAFFGVDLATELAGYAVRCGDVEAALESLRNACEFAFCDAEQKARLRGEVDASWAREFSGGSSVSGRGGGELR